MLRFLLGLTPVMLQMPYLIDDSRMDLDAHKGPSTPMSCEMCAGLAATYGLKILLNRGEVVAAPRALHFDAYLNKLKTTWRPGGNNNPLQQLGLKIARKRLGEKRKLSAKDQKIKPVTAVERILELARWAPSGDNTQPWRFEIIDDNHFNIHANDTRDWCVYDLDGRASQIAVGALMETIAISASGEKMKADFTLLEESSETNPVIAVALSLAPDEDPSPLLPFIKVRTTQRRALLTKTLTDSQKQALEESAGSDFHIKWIEEKQQKRHIAKLLFDNAKIRLTIPEAYDVHKKIIEWDAQFSYDRIPDQAVGLDPAPLKLMRWAMHSWKRVDMLNRYFAGTLMPRIQLDLIPGLRCGAHFVILSNKPLETLADYLEAGRAVQRFWLTAAKVGLQLQPEMTPLIFSRYIATSKNFTDNKKALKEAEQLSQSLQDLLGEEFSRYSAFMGRVGQGNLPASRSLRKSLESLSGRE